jgi:hypothetical protein
MPERDPRVDPRPGDKVRDCVVCRRYDLTLTYHDAQGNLESCSLESWRKWGKDAEVIHAAD